MQNYLQTTICANQSTILAMHGDKLVESIFNNVQLDTPYTLKQLSEIVVYLRGYSTRTQSNMLRVIITNLRLEQMTTNRVLITKRGSKLYLFH